VKGPWKCKVQVQRHFKFLILKSSPMNINIQL